jgi:hypothetical protein
VTRAEHPVFAPPTDPDTPIWRYFDLPKFISLLDSKGLYFCRADLLGDPLEGSFTRAREVQRQRLLREPPPGWSREELERSLNNRAAFFADMRSCTYVNCWHLGDHESMAMWNGYGGGPYGIAVRSRVGLLDRLLPDKYGPAPTDHVFIRRVSYIDYSSELEHLPDEHHAYAPFVCKSLAYAHESELRAVFSDMSLYRTSECPVGRLLPVDLQCLIERVTVSPLAPSWFDVVVRTKVSKGSAQSPDGAVRSFGTTPSAGCLRRSGLCCAHLAF